MEKNMIRYVSTTNRRNRLIAELGRLIEPSEIAKAICFLIANSEVSGHLVTDAGWHPPF
jgi:NAD(P)-dependent dehydrogenase (short-subunit alcohol dehydrogenase family)